MELSRPPTGAASRALASTPRPGERPICLVEHQCRVPSGQGVTLDDITTQLAAARATDYLALLVVVPPAEETGREAAELRRLLADSLHRYDLVVLDRGDLERIIAAGDSKTLIDLFVEQGIALGRLSPT